MPKRKQFPKGSVCKPCWELKYCPYGPLVEYYPILGGGMTLTDVKRTYAEIVQDLATGASKEEKDILDDVRRLHLFTPALWEALEEHDPNDVSCRIFGHVCPVFFTQSGATETKESRREGRFVPRDIMLKVVRRDNHVCQLCHQYVPDDHVEFDHIIPVAKGGPTSVQNLRLLCRGCNRNKSDGLGELLSEV